MIDNLESAFLSREKPAIENCVVSNVFSEERDEVLAFCEYSWGDLTADILEYYFFVFSFLSPDAYIYYLPGVLKCGMEEGVPDLLVNQSIVAVLDRSPDPALWDGFFLARWGRLSLAELDVIEGWLFWLVDSQVFDDSSLERALITISILKDKSCSPVGRVK